MNDGWRPLYGGNVNSVARRGGVVRRRLGASSPAVHQLLRHLEARSVPLVPRLLRATAREEFLTFLPGEAVFRPWPDEVKTDAWPAQLGSWLRRYHEAVRGFQPENAPFLWGPSAPTENMLVCHGDLGPWSCLHEAGRLTGVIDWDLARYGHPLDDVAELALEIIPLHPRLEETLGASVPHQILIRRLHALCRAYGAATEKVLHHVPLYLEGVIEDTLALAAHDVEPFSSFVKGGVADALMRDQAHVLKRWH